jgi:hypothetical protein
VVLLISPRIVNSGSIPDERAKAQRGHGNHVFSSTWLRIGNDHLSARRAAEPHEGRAGDPCSRSAWSRATDRAHGPALRRADVPDLFVQLGLEQPDLNLGVGSGSHARQTAEVMIGMEDEFTKNSPSLAALYGDVNSMLGSARRAQPAAHRSAVRAFVCDLARSDGTLGI